MPKKKAPPMTQAEQSERFREAVRDLERDGELREDAEQRLESLLLTTALSASPRRERA